MTEGRRAIWLAVLVVCGTFPVVVGAAGPATAADTGPTIFRTTELSLTPSEPGQVDVEVEFTVPDTVSQIRTRLPRSATEVESAGFENVGNTTWEWERGDGRPTLSFTLEVNQSGRAATLPKSHDEPGYLFVDVGPWAVVDVPRMPTQWLRSGPPVTFKDDVTIDGVGATGGEMAYLGPFEEYSRTAHDQEFRLIVPEAAELGPGQSAILDALAHASDRLRVGERDAQVVIFAVPETLNWGARGLAGGSDAWVVADERLDQAFNPWIHEYIHTRQAFIPGVDTRWIVEATATYYAALFTLQQGHIDYQEFRELLEQGAEPPVDESVLAFPGTWQGAVPYLKGGLVWGRLDYELRQSTEGQSAAADLFERFNHYDGRITQTVLLDTTAEVGDSGIADLLESWTTTRDTPEMWSVREHTDTFGTEPPRFAYELVDEPFTVSGPYRNLTRLPGTVVVGETLELSAEVTNVGDLQGSYDTALRIGGRPVAELSGTLAPGEREGITASHTFQEAGVVTVSLGSERVEVRVAEPATPNVTSLTVNRTTLPEDGAVSVEVTLRNEEEWPAGTPVQVSRGNESVATVTPRLLAGETATESVRIVLSEPGEHVISAGDQEVSVTVDGSGASGPGFGLVPTLIAVLVLGTLLGHRITTREGR